MKGGIGLRRKIVLPSGASTKIKLLKTAHVEDRSVHTNSES